MGYKSKQKEPIDGSFTYKPYNTLKHFSIFLFVFSCYGLFLMFLPRLPVFARIFLLFGSVLFFVLAWASVVQSRLQITIDSAGIKTSDARTGRSYQLLWTEVVAVYRFYGLKGHARLLFSKKQFKNLKEIRKETRGWFTRFNGPILSFNDNVCFLPGDKIDIILSFLDERLQVQDLGRFL